MKGLARSRISKSGYRDRPSPSKTKMASMVDRKLLSIFTLCRLHVEKTLDRRRPTWIWVEKKTCIDHGETRIRKGMRVKGHTLLSETVACRASATMALSSRLNPSTSEHWFDLAWRNINSATSSPCSQHSHQSLSPPLIPKRELTLPNTIALKTWRRFRQSLGSSECVMPTSRSTRRSGFSGGFTSTMTVSPISTKSSLSPVSYGLKHKSWIQRAFNNKKKYKSLPCFHGMPEHSGREYYQDADHHAQNCPQTPVQTVKIESRWWFWTEW